MKRGVIFCHGHLHSQNKFPKYLPKDVRWTLVDINSKNLPDVVGSIYSILTLEQLGIHQYDYILSQGCPIQNNISKLIAFLRSSRLLLKSHGKVMVPIILGYIVQQTYLKEYRQIFNSPILCELFHQTNLTEESKIYGIYACEELNEPHLNESLKDNIRRHIARTIMINRYHKGEYPLVNVELQGIAEATGYSSFRIINFKDVIFEAI